MTVGKPSSSVPPLRFAEFREEGEWEPTKLGDIAEFFKGKGLPKSKLTPDGPSPCIHYGELFTAYPEVISTVHSRTDAQGRLFLSVEDDVLMPTSDVTPNGLAKACCVKVRNVIIGGDILVIRTNKQNISGEFLARYIRRLEQRILQLVTGSTVYHLYATSLRTLDLRVPTKPEQQQIASCFSSLDDLIAAENRKLETLRLHKQGLMQQLFPLPGQTIPQLRFPEFQDAPPWSSSPLDSVCEVLNKRRVPITQKDRKAGPFPYYGASGIVDYVDDFIFDERLILVGEDGAKWGPYEQTAFIADGKFWVNNHAHVLRSVELIDSLLEAHLVRSDLGRYVTGAAPPKLTLGKLKTIPIPIPSSPAEQQKIADCLGSLEDLIAAKVRKVKTLKQHKQGLLQQLFPKPETL